jgi:hypothetical protein
MKIADLPAINATLNGISAILLTIGWVLISKRRIEQHRKVMLSAFATSTLGGATSRTRPHQVASASAYARKNATPARALRLLPRLGFAARQ